MNRDIRYMSVIVQPPLNVANSLLEEVRKLAGRFRETDGEAEWAGPQNYAVSLVALNEDDVESRAGVDALLHNVTRNINEIGAKLSPPELEVDEGDTGTVVTRLYGRDDEITGLSDTICDELREAGFTIDESRTGQIPLARVAGPGNIEAMRACIDDRDVPLASWLLSGICLARIVEHDKGLPMVSRTAFIPLKRIWSRHLPA